MPQTSAEAPYTESQQQEILEELRRILATEAFKRSASLSGLLLFLVKQDLAGEAQGLKEAYIGHVHYGRKPGYDTKADALVRVSANRLRLRLREYYAAAPLPLLRIEIPSGTYVPRYVWPDAAMPAEPSAGAFASAPVAAAMGSGSKLAEQPVAEEIEIQTETEPGKPIPVRFPRRLFPRAKLAALAERPISVVAAVGTVLVLLLGLTAGGLALERGWHAPPPEQWQARPISRLGGVQEFAAFSPDDRQIAFAWSTERDLQSTSLYVKSRNSDSARQLTFNHGVDTRPAWSPDGREIAFVHQEGDEKELRILTLSSGRQRVVTRLEGSYPWLCQVPRLSWTRDARQIITVESLNRGAPCRVTAVDLATGVKQALSSGGTEVMADVEPAVSPDGQRIAFLRNTGTLVGDIYTMNLRGGDVRRVTADQRDVMGFCWDSLSKGFILASRRGDGLLRLWHDEGDGAPQRITDGLAAIGFPVSSADGRSMAVSVYRNETNVWRVWADGRPPQRLIADQDSNADAETSPDGRHLVFRSDRSGSVEIWVSDRDGLNPHRLTFLNGSMVSRPRWSPDGVTIAFECRDRGHIDLCEIPSNGGLVQHPVNWESNQQDPVWARQGSTLYFVSNHSGRSELYKLDRGQSAPEQVTANGALWAVPEWSSPGLLLARDQPAFGIYCGPGAAGALKQPACPQGQLLLPVSLDAALTQWDAAPGGFWYVKPSEANNSTALFRYDLHARRSFPLLTFPHGLMLGDRVISVDPGGQSALVVEQGPQNADLDLLERRP